MKLEISTDICPVINVGTYWGALKNVLNYIREDCIQQYLECVVMYGKETLQDIFKEKCLTDVFGDTTIDNVSLYSPKEYNVSDDYLIFNATLCQVNMDKIKEYSTKEFFEFTKQFGSCDGFISYYPTESNSYEDELKYIMNENVYVYSMYILWILKENNVDLNEHQENLMLSIDHCCEMYNWYEHEEEY